MNTIMLGSAEYRAFLTEVKARVLETRSAAASAVNSHLLLMYWEIGRGIADRQETLGWGKSVIECLSRDLRAAFPGSRGFSPRNLWDMRRFFVEYSGDSILRTLSAEIPRGDSGTSISALAHSAAAVLIDGAQETLPGSLLAFLAQISWSHHLLIMNSVKDSAARFFYIQTAARMSWSHDVLYHQIKGQCYERSLKLPKSHNFASTLPDEAAERAEGILKGAYDLAFVGTPNPARERELEARLMSKVQRFMLELGYGFCFVGRQHRITLGENEYFIDLLFYHRFLRALVAMEIKLGRFEPEYAGKMDFYLNVLNDTERAPGDNLSIGIVLCASKSDLVVEYSLRTIGNPIGVANHRLTPELPTDLKGQLPTEADLRAIVQSELDDEEAKAES